MTYTAGTTNALQTIGNGTIPYFKNDLLVTKGVLTPALRGVKTLKERMKAAELAIVELETP